MQCRVSGRLLDVGYGFSRCRRCWSISSSQHLPQMMQRSSQVTPFSSKLHFAVTAALWQRAAGHGESAASAMRLRMSRLEQPRPGLQNLLRAHRIGDNAMVAFLLIQQAERYHACKR